MTTYLRQGTAASANMAELLSLLAAKNPLHRSFLNHALGNLSDEEECRLEAYLSFCKIKGLTIDYIAESYLLIVKDTLREQAFFRKHKRYRYSTFSETGDSVYFNEEYMSMYMYGLALTSFLWPNHLAMFRFFKRTLPTVQGGNYLEIGPGHGIYMLTAMERSGYDRFLGVDISETSIAQTRAVLDQFAPAHAGKAALLRTDFLDAALPEPSYDAIVMGEVLEHVEQPGLFLRRIAKLARPDGHIFVTTCINAPAIDHIFLFRDPVEIKSLFAESGLVVRDELICPYEGTTLEESLDRLLAINVAYVLGKA